jgi:pimeloyl-ACP methyl ester carboxylesterase
MFEAGARRLSMRAALAGAACLAVLSAGSAALGADQPAAPAPPVRPQDLVGVWQGSAPGAFKVTRTADGKLHGEQEFGGPGETSGFTRNGNPVSSITIKGRHVRMELDEMAGTFDGDLSADGQTWAGTFTTPYSVNRFEWKRTTAKTLRPADPSPHKVLYVPVDKDVRLEVLDWGGQGPPLIFLPGNGNSAHVFDEFAPKFTGKHHVYGVTRRGFGMSSKPEPNGENYDADRLGDDVLAVIDALKLDRPVIAGHSLGGEELSSIGTRHPEKVRGLIYLDAGYGYAFYNPKADNTEVDASTMRRDLAEVMTATPSRTKVLIAELQATMPALEKELEVLRKAQDGEPDRPTEARRMPRDRIEEAIFTSMRKYSGVKAPALAIYASPHACTGFCITPQYKAQEASVAAQADAFQAGTPSARVVRIAGASHYVFQSDEADVIREINAFMDGLR